MSDLSDQSLSDRPVAMNDEPVLELIEDDPQRDTLSWMRNSSTIVIKLPLICIPWKGMEIWHMDTSWFERLPASSAEGCVHKRLEFPSEFHLAYSLIAGDKKGSSLNHTRSRQWLGCAESGITTSKLKLHTYSVFGGTAEESFTGRCYATLLLSPKSTASIWIAQGLLSSWQHKSTHCKGSREKTPKLGIHVLAAHCIR